MNINKQDRERRVTLSAAKGLARWAERCFAALSMTIPVVVVKFHHVARKHKSVNEECLRPPEYQNVPFKLCKRP
jgi:hypothetical protein